MRISNCECRVGKHEICKANALVRRSRLALSGRIFAIRRSKFEILFPNYILGVVAVDRGEHSFLHKKHSHRLKCAGKWVQNKPEDFQRYNTQERFVTRLSDYDRSMTLSLGKRNVALGNLALNSRTISEREGH